MSITHDRPILLAHSYFLRYDAKQHEKMKPYPPLATMIVASLVRERGYDVQLFDAMLADGVSDFIATLHRVRPAVVGIIEDNFNFLTKMCTVRMRQAAHEMIRAAKETGCHVAVNGSDASDRPEDYLEAGADVVIVGEPEHTLLQVLERWTGPTSVELDDIPGLVMRSAALHPSDNGQLRIQRTSGRGFLEDLDSLPFPAWDLIDVERYRRAWTGAHRRLSWNVVTSRGCPYRCNWCAKPLFGTRYAQRSPADVAEELRLVRAHVNPDHVWFADDIFGLTPEWIEAFAKEVVARDAQVPFMMQSRVNLMKPRVVEALAAAGAEEVWLGVESGSQKILDAMDKGTKVEHARLATRALKQSGIRACWFIQLGYPGEAWSDIESTRNLIREERPDDIGVSVSYPLPGTKFYDLVKDQLGAKRNWDHSDDLAMLFHGNYSSEFYRTIRQLFHEEVRSGESHDARWLELTLAEPTAQITPTIESVPVASR